MVYRPGELETFTKKALIVIALAAGVALLWFTRQVLFLIFIAAVLAAGISPAVHRVRVIGRQLLRRNIPRGTAILAVFFPFLEDTSFAARLLGAIDLVFVWWFVSVAIGLGVLYRRRTGPIATTLLVIYVSIGAIIAAIKTATAGA